MTLLSAFNPHEMKADTVLKVATGREEPFARLLDIIRGNLTAPTKQHVIVSAPRGYGKSFLLRYVQVKIAQIAKDEGLPVAMALLPEELPHVKEPDTLLAEIRRTFLNEPADTVGVRWVEDDGEAWYQSVAELDAAVTERLGTEGLLIAGVENFDLLVRKAFAKDVHAGSLREFLTRKGNRVMLLTASARGAFDRAYDRPLFKAFEEIALEPWSVNDCIAFFHAQCAAAGRPPLTDVQEAKAKAVATFIGGTPRLATLIGEALLDDDPLRAADLLDKLVDELTPYYKERIEVLPTRSQALLDGLLRGGEKCSATELAVRVGAPNQPAIAAPLDELRKDLIVVGEKAPDSAEVLLSVTDRVFAHYYRKRILRHGQETCPLEALVDLLAVFYSPEEKRREAEKLKVRGLVREAAVMEQLWEADRARGATVLRPTLERERSAFAGRMNEWHRLTDEGRFEEGLGILNEALTEARATKNPYWEIEAIFARARTLSKLGRDNEALSTAREAATLAKRIGEVDMQAMILRQAAFSLGMLDRYDEALDTACQVVALAEQTGDMSGQAAALRQAASSLKDLQRYDEALATAREAVALADRAGDVDEQTAALRQAASSLSMLRRLDEALATAREAAVFAERADQPVNQALCLKDAASYLLSLGQQSEAVTTIYQAAALAARTRDAIAQRLVAYDALTFRTLIGLDLAFASYNLLTKPDERGDYVDARLWFDDIAHIATKERAWPRLAAMVQQSPKAAERIGTKLLGPSEAGKVIVAAHTDQGDAGLSQARHLVAALAQAIEIANNPALAGLWIAVLDAAAEEIGTNIQDAAFLREFADILAAHPAAPERAKSLIAAAAAYHASGRDPKALARLEPDLATTLMTVFPSKRQPAMKGRKPRARLKR